MRNYKKELEEQLAEIQSLLKKSNKNLSRYKDLSNPRIYISQSHGCIQFYLKKEGEAKQYIHKKDRKKITKYLQRDYDLDVHKKLTELETRLKEFLNTYNPELGEEYERFPDYKRELIRPFIETESQFVDAWLDEHEGMQNTFPIEGQFLTNQGEQVRSKSEKIIADALDRFHVPYRYEPVLELRYGFVYPDFVVLNRRTRKTMYWEHFGMVADEEYASKNFMKIQSYEREGYLLGRDLIATIESAEEPLDVKLVEEKIREYLL